jgi:hypothetical protein
MILPTPGSKRDRGGPKWREALAEGLSRLPDAQWELLANAIRRAGGSQKPKAEEVGFRKGRDPGGTQGNDCL